MKSIKIKESYQFRSHQSYAAEDILAAGGTSAFAHKTGLSGKKQMEAITKIPVLSFTDKEWDEVLEILKNDK